MLINLNRVYSAGIWTHNLLFHDSPPITTRPVLPPNYLNKFTRNSCHKDFLKCWNHLRFFLSTQIRQILFFDLIWGNYAIIFHWAESKKGEIVTLKTNERNGKKRNSQLSFIRFEVKIIICHLHLNINGHLNINCCFYLCNRRWAVHT